MNLQNFTNNLVGKNIISAKQSDQLLDYEQNKPLSIHWELRTLLYFGITSLSTGLGILIYQNIDTIGHNVLIALIALACGFCFWYAYKHRHPFTWQEVSNESKMVDFALLGACLLFLTLGGYLQYQYNIFGTRYGLAAFIPAVVFLFCAYFFDHRGVLSMGITALASWLGLNIAPLEVIGNLNLSDNRLVFTGIGLGIILVAVGWLSDWQDRKKHFSFMYYLFGGNLAFVASLSALLFYDGKIIYLLLIAGLCFLTIRHARLTKSFLLLLMGVVYGYIAITYFIFYHATGEFFIFYPFYFMATAGGVIWFFMSIKKILGITKDD